ncbi:hypothetical protein OC844_001437 [Tilletia horrida]|nr:hypothetical protein OC844_001437 [Tilletia horrida]
MYRDAHRHIGASAASRGDDDVVATSDQEDFDLDSGDALFGVGQHGTQGGGANSFTETQEDALQPAVVRWRSPPPLPAAQSPGDAAGTFRSPAPREELLDLPDSQLQESQLDAEELAMAVSSPASTVPLSPAPSQYQPSRAASPAPAAASPQSAIERLSASISTPASPSADAHSQIQPERAPALASALASRRSPGPTDPQLRAAKSPAPAPLSDSDDDIDMLSKKSRRIFDESQASETALNEPRTPARPLRAGSLPPIWPSPTPASIHPEKDVTEGEARRDAEPVAAEPAELQAAHAHLEERNIAASQEPQSPRRQRAGTSDSFLALEQDIAPHSGQVKTSFVVGNTERRDVTLEHVEPELPTQGSNSVVLHTEAAQTLLAASAPSSPSSALRIPQTLSDVQTAQEPVVRAAQEVFQDAAGPSADESALQPSKPAISGAVNLPDRQRNSLEIVIPVRTSFTRTLSNVSAASSDLSDVPASFSPQPNAGAGPSNLDQAGASSGAPPSPRTAAALEAVQREHNARQQRSLRTRNPSQLNPYQIEAQRYAAALLRNDWEDALIGQRSVRVQEMRRLADEERATKKARAPAGDGPLDPDDETQDWLVDDMGSSDDSAYTEVSDGHGGRKRQIRSKEAGDSVDKENISPTKKKANKERIEVKLKRKQERMAAAAAKRPEPATIHHPGIKRARPVMPPIRPRSPPRQPTEDLSYLLPQSDDEVDLLRARPLPAFVRNRRGRDGGNVSDSDSSSAPPLTGIKRKRPSAFRSGASSGSETSENDIGATAGMQPTGLFDDFSADVARVTAMQRTHLSTARRVQPRNDEDSDSDAEYRRLFKDLRKMMPFHMARKYIEDVKNMRKGKAYHSDGHVSSTPEPSSDDQAGRSSAVDRNQRSTPATSPPPESEEIRPGEARKRRGPRDEADANSSRFALVGDSQSSSSDSEEAVRSVISVSSEASDGDRGVAGRDTDTDQSDRDNSWWTRPVIGPSRKPKKPKDSIDLLLSRAGGQKKARRKHAATSSRVAGGTRQSRLETMGVRRMPAGFGKSAHGNAEGSKSSRPKEGGSSHKSKRMRQSRLHVVQDKRPTVDLLDDDTLFEFDMPAQREDEFAFLNRSNTVGSTDDAAANGPLPRVAPPSNAGPALNSSAPSSFQHYMHPPIGPLTPATTAGPSFASVESERRAPQQPIQMVPPAIGPDSVALPQSHVEDRRVQRPPIGQSLSSPAPSTASSGLQAAQQMDAETWATYRRLRVDFGIQPLPFGLHFAPSSYLARGCLARILQAARAEAAPASAAEPLLAQNLFAFGMQLRLDADILQVLDNLPSLFDAMFVAILPDVSDTAASSLGLRGAAEDALAFLGLYLTKVPRSVEPQRFDTLYEAIKAELSRMCDRLQATAKLGSEAHRRAALSMRWFAVEYAWRALIRTGAQHDAAIMQVDYALELSFAAQHLMLHLCKHGLHRTFKTIRTAVLNKDDNHVMSDVTAELWICLIHLLQRVVVASPEAERICSFWAVFEAANKLLIDRGVGRQRLGASERTWYSVFAICALSQFGAASGMTGDRPLITQHWPLITYALSLVRFRFDEKTEKTMSSTSVQRRDGYIRVVLQRCLTLSTKWGWHLDNAEVTLSKLFDIFNSHKLCNLPSEIERTHDFPAFLCKYDEGCLKELTPDDLGECHHSGRPLVFHVFVKLLARAAYDLRTRSENELESQRKISRLFSRMSPVRTMPFTKTTPPTSIERSILFNHYTMVLLYLLFVPSAANQRLRQLRSFLPFSGADIASQMTCIRAMLYIGVLFRHHELPLQPVTTWFSEALPMLVQQHEALERQRLSGSKTGPYKDWTATAIYRELRSTSTLLIAALRAIQHVLKHPSLDKSASLKPAGYPDLQLLQTDWIKTVLEGQVAIDPAIGREAMNTIQEFLKQRNQVIAASQTTKSRSAAAQQDVDMQEESQDSFAGMFDDVDMLMDDPLLASMLGEVSTGSDAAPAQSTLNAKDAEFAELIKGTISPALFRLLSNVYHPDRAKAGKRISLSFDTRLSLATLGRPLREQRMLLEQQRNRQRYVELIVDCWAGCADVLVRNGLRDWDKYFSAFGDESWKRIADPIGRRDVGLRFLNTALQRDPAAYEMYEGEFVSMWYQATVSRLLSIQDKYTRTLLEIDGDGPFFRHMPWTRDPETGAVAKLRDTDFVKHRLAALLQGFDNLSQEFARPPALGSKTNRKPMIFASVSAMVAAMRQNIEDTPTNHPDRKDYLRFCLKVVHGMKERLGPGIMRGAGAEVTALETHLLSLGATLLSTAEEAAARKAKEVEAMLKDAARVVATGAAPAPAGGESAEVKEEEKVAERQREVIVVD